MKQAGPREQLEEAVVKVTAQGLRLGECLKTHSGTVEHSPSNVLQIRIWSNRHPGKCWKQKGAL